MAGTVEAGNRRLECGQIFGFILIQSRSLRERDVPVRRNFEIDSPVARPDAAVLDVARQTVLIAVQIDNADALTCLQQGNGHMHRKRRLA